MCNFDVGFQYSEYFQELTAEALDFLTIRKGDRKVEGPRGCAADTRV